MIRDSRERQFDGSAAGFECDGYFGMVLQIECSSFNLNQFDKPLSLTSSCPFLMSSVLQLDWMIPYDRIDQILSFIYQWCCSPIIITMPTLKIKTITNRELSCTYEQDYTVRMLKENIEHKEGMPVDQFKLIYMGQQMDEMKKLCDYKISAGSYIIMVPSLRGG